jgi:hypothetical protein
MSDDPSRRPREERGLLRVRSAMLAEAERRGKRSLRTEPRARAARYDRRTGRVHVDLTNGCTFAFRRATHKVWSAPAMRNWHKSKFSGSGSVCTGSASMSISAFRTCSPECSARRPTWTASERHGRAQQHRPRRRRRLPGATAQRAVARARPQRQGRGEELMLGQQEAARFPERPLCRLNQKVRVTPI